jgi:hypothetical protein
MIRPIRVELCSLLFITTAFLWELSASGQSFDGFVTSINSPREFDVGTSHGEMTGATKCTSVLVYRLLIIPDGWYDGAAEVYYPKPRGILAKSAEKQTAYRTGPIKCETTELSVGSRVHLDGGGERSGGTAVPDQIVIYKVVEPPPHGVALMEEVPHLNRTTGGWTGRLWLDGYPFLINSKTEMFSASDDTGIHYSASPNGAIRVSASISHRVESPTPGGTSPTQGVWAAYKSTSILDGSLAATELRMWPSGGSQESKFNAKFAISILPPDYPANMPGEIKLNGNVTAAHLLSVESLQRWVSRLGQELIPKVQDDPPRGDESPVRFRFYITSSIDTMETGYFSDVDGMLPSFTPHIGEAPEFARGRVLNPQSGHTGEIFASPDGVILIPDTLLVKLRNTAQAASLLSFAITSVLQKQGYRAWPEIMSPQAQSRIGLQGREYFNSFRLWQEEQQLRIGIRQMYLAGYDFREAPYAWACAQDKLIANPLIASRDPSKEIPWYSAYAFNYISQYYGDVDYRVLKRGDEEYAQFLEDLRKADPAAFDQKN